MNSNLVFILLLLFAAALIIFAVLPPLRRWQRDREWEEFGTDLDIGGAIAGRIDGAGSPAAAPQERLEARADPTGGQDGERTQTDIALEELRRLERLNVSLDDEFDAFEEYLSGRRQERARQGGPSQTLRGIEARNQGARRDPAGRDLRRGPGEQGDRPGEVERPSDLPAAYLDQAPDDPHDPRVAVEAEAANGRYLPGNGLGGGTDLTGVAGISPTDTAQDLVRAAGGPAAGADRPDVHGGLRPADDTDSGIPLSPSGRPQDTHHDRPSDQDTPAYPPQRGPARENGREPREAYDWKAAAQYERARAARAAGAGRSWPDQADARPADAPRPAGDAAPSTPPFGVGGGRLIDRHDLAAQRQAAERPVDDTAQRQADEQQPAPAARHGWPPAADEPPPSAPGTPRVHVVEPAAQQAEPPSVHVVESPGGDREPPRIRVVEPAAARAHTGAPPQGPPSQAARQPRETGPYPVQVVTPQPRPAEPAGVHAVPPPGAAAAAAPSAPPQARAGYAATPPGGAQPPAPGATTPGIDMAGAGTTGTPDQGATAGRPSTLPDPPFMEPQPQPGAAGAQQGATPSLPELPPVLSEDEINDLRSRWLEIKASFPDDPITAVREAKQLVNECTDLLAERLEVRRDQGEVSTEDLRLALRRYVAFYERLLWA